MIGACRVSPVRSALVLCQRSTAPLAPDGIPAITGLSISIGTLPPPVPPPHGPPNGPPREAPPALRAGTKLSSPIFSQTGRPKSSPRQPKMNPKMPARREEGQFCYGPPFVSLKGSPGLRSPQDLLQMAFRARRHGEGTLNKERGGFSLCTYVCMYVLYLA